MGPGAAARPGRPTTSSSLTNAKDRTFKTVRPNQGTACGVTSAGADSPAPPARSYPVEDPLAQHGRPRQRDRTTKERRPHADRLPGRRPLRRPHCVSASADRSARKSDLRTVTHPAWPADTIVAWTPTPSQTSSPPRRLRSVLTGYAVCSHYGGPLDEGELAGSCVVCPWHGSRFRLSDGSVAAGPATVPQLSYDVRTVDDRLQVRAAQ